MVRLVSDDVNFSRMEFMFHSKIAKHKKHDITIKIIVTTTK